jgi:hypothetical protein
VSSSFTVNNQNCPCVMRSSMNCHSLVLTKGRYELLLSRFPSRASTIPSKDEIVVFDEGVGESFGVSGAGSERSSEASLDNPSSSQHHGREQLFWSSIRLPSGSLQKEDLAGETRDGRGCSIAGDEGGEAFCPNAHLPPPSSSDGNAASTISSDEPTCILLRYCGL